MAKAYICDPCLVHMGGHPAVWTARFAALFSARGIEATIFSHGFFPETQIDGIPVKMQFTRTAWHMDDQTDLLKIWDLYFANNRRMAEDMQRLQKGIHLKTPHEFAEPAVPLEPEDVVVFTTITQFQLSGLMSWYRLLPADRRPTVICSLMAPSGVMVEPKTGEVKLHSFDTARFYKLAFRNVDGIDSKLHFIALGQAHAAQYSHLRGKPVATYPMLNTAIQPDTAVRADSGKRALLYAGAAAQTKGAHHLPAVLDGLCTRHPDWTFTVQIGNGLDTPESKKLHSWLMAAAAEKYSNFEYVAKRLDDPAYCRLFNESDLVVVPYDPVAYLNQSSGIVWEAIATANMLVVPANCCLEWEVQSQGAEHVAFPEFTAAAIVDAVSSAISKTAETRPQRIRKAHAFKAENTAARLERQIFELWQS